MARANIPSIWGFQPVNARESDYIPVDVASGYATAIYPGEPVLGITDGTVSRTPAGSAAGAATDGITGVVVEVLQYQQADGQVRVTGTKYLPASTTWTAHANRSRLLIIPSTADVRYRVKASVAVASLAAGRALRWGNADHSYGSADTGLGLSGVALNLATLGTTATLQWRIVGVEETPSNDVTQANFILTVVPNLHYGWPIVGHSATGL